MGTRKKMRCGACGQMVDSEGHRWTCSGRARIGGLLREATWDDDAERAANAPPKPRKPKPRCAKKKERPTLGPCRFLQVLGRPWCEPHRSYMPEVA